MSIHIIDGNNILRRKFEVGGLSTLPSLYYDACQSPRGAQIWVWDGKNGKSKRKALYPEYKGTSSQPSDEFYQTVNLLKELLSYSKAIQIEVPEYEADDVIATIAKSNTTELLTIDSNDADFLQLVNDKTILNFTHKRTQETPAEDIRLYKTLVGDHSDNISGLKGFGEKTFYKLSRDAKTYLSLIFESKLEPDATILSNDCNIKNKLLDQFIDSLPELKIFYEIIDFIPVDWEEIERNTKVGVNDPLKAQALFSKYELGGE